MNYTKSVSWLSVSTKKCAVSRFNFDVIPEFFYNFSFLTIWCTLRFLEANFLTTELYENTTVQMCDCDSGSEAICSWNYTLKTGFAKAIYAIAIKMFVHVWRCKFVETVWNLDSSSRIILNHHHLVHKVLINWLHIFICWKNCKWEPNKFLVPVNSQNFE